MTNELAKREKGIEQIVFSFSNRLTNCAMRNYKQERFLRSAVVAITSDPVLMDMAQSEKGRLEIYNALRAAAVTGLSLNPQEKKAALVVYGNKTDKGDYRKVQYQQQKDGLIDIALATGKIKAIVFDRVYENDNFDIEKNTDTDSYTFKPALRDRGGVIGYFAAVAMEDGITRVHWMTKEEVEEHSDNYSSAKRRSVAVLNNPKSEDWEKRKAENSPWLKSFDGMALKTVIRMLLTRLYLPGDFNELLASDQGDGPIVVEGTAEVIDDGPGTPPEKVTAQLEGNKKRATKIKEQPEAEQKQGDII